MLNSTNRSGSIQPNIRNPISLKLPTLESKHSGNLSSNRLDSQRLTGLNKKIKVSRKQRNDKMLSVYCHQRVETSVAPIAPEITHDRIQAMRDTLERQKRNEMQK